MVAGLAAGPSPEPRLRDRIHCSPASVMEGKFAPGVRAPKLPLPEVGAPLEPGEVSASFSPRTRREPLRRRGVGDVRGWGILESRLRAAKEESELEPQTPRLNRSAALQRGKEQGILCGGRRATQGEAGALSCPSVLASGPLLAEPPSAPRASTAPCSIAFVVGLRVGDGEGGPPLAEVPSLRACPGLHCGWRRPPAGSAGSPG